MNLKKFFFVVTATQRWGRSTSLGDAYKSAGVKNPLKEHHVVYTGVLKKEATESEADNLVKCWNVMEGGNLRFLDEPSKKDRAMCKKLFVGWLTEEIGKPKR